MADHDATSTSQDRDGLSVEVDGLVYALDQVPRRHGRRSIITVRLADHPGSTGFVDKVDLYAFRSRHGFARRVADQFGRDVGDVMGHLAVVLDQVERDEPRQHKPAEMSAERKTAAEKLLEEPDLLDRAAKAMDALGYVGEEANKRLCYLIATSRLLAKPLSTILMAPSGSGKSELLDIVAKMMPTEQVEYLSRLTPQALYYAGSEHLRHKLVIVDEQAGATEADYAIRTLQSKGLLRLAVPLRGRSEPFTVHGPISLMSGTTSDSLNSENLSRVLELSLDDSPEQTKRIQAAQRRAWAGKRSKQVDLDPWCDAQRLLQPLDVVIPFAAKLKFPARTTHDRRGNAKLLGLVAAHALLHQHQRERDRHDRVVAVVDDYRVIYNLLRASVAADVDGLSPRAATALRQLRDVHEPITRRELGARLGWSYMTAKRALEELREQELVRVVDPGEVPRRYVLVDGPAVLGQGAKLTPPDEVG